MIEPCSIEQVAEFLGVKVPTVRKWVLNRNIPFYRFGGRIVFDRKDLEEFIKSNRVEATGPLMKMRGRTGKSVSSNGVEGT